MSVDPGPASPSTSSWMSRHFVWLLVCFSLLSTFPYYGRINNPNENVRIWMVKAIVEKHELAINRVSQEWGYVNDKAIMNGRLYSSKAPGCSFVGVPIYFVQRAIARLAGIATVSKRSMTLALRLFGVGLPLCFFLFFFARYVERVSGSATARDLLVAGLGLGTMLFPYGVLFVGHATAAALAFSGFMLLSGESPERPRPGSLAWAGALIGLSVVFEYQVVFAAICLVGYAVVRYRRAAIYVAVGALPAAVALGAYHTVLFGRPWDFPLGHIENPDWARLHNQMRLFGLGLPSPTAAGAVLFAPDYGLFVFSPFLLVGLTASVFLLRRIDWLEGAVILAITVVMVVFLAGAPTPHPGWCVGPRYIAVVAPFLAAGIAHAWRRTRRVFLLSAIVAGLVIPSALLNVVSGAVYPHYPEAFDNPVFDLVFPLLGAGYVPYSLGWLIGLPGLWSMVPLLLAAAMAVGIAIAGNGPRAMPRVLHATVAVLVATVFLLPLSRYGRQPRDSEIRATAFVRSTWEPPPAR